MKHSRLALFLVLVPGLIAAAAAQDKWVEISSPNFKVNTNAGDKKGREAAQRFEQMRSLFASLLMRGKLREDVPLTILAFKNSGGVKQIAPLWKGKPVQVAGFYVAGSGKDFIVVDLSSEEAWHVVFHEYAHALLERNFQKTPLWFREGFAEYFSTIRIRKNEVLIGHPPSNYGDFANFYGLNPYEKIFAIKHESKEYNESTEWRTNFYVQSWLLVHYLYDNRLLTQAAKYFTLTEDRGVPQTQALKEAFGLTFRELDDKVRAYLQANRVAIMSWTPPSTTEPVTFNLRTLNDYESTALVAELQMYSESHLDKAEAAFKQILAKKPDFEPALRGLGYLALRKNRRDEADEYFRKAGMQGSTDPHTYFLLAVSRYNDMNRNTTSEDLIEMAGLLDKAIALNPGYAEAFALKSEVLARARNLVEAIALGKKAVELDPKNERYRLNLAFKYMYNDQLDAAIALNKALTSSQDPVIASEAQKQLATAQEWKERPLLRLNAHSNPYFKDGKDKQQQEKISAELEELLKAQTGEADDDDKDTREVKFVKGTLVSVDCSVDPGAVLSLSVAGKPMKLKVKSRRKVLLIGGENFDCGWKNKKIAANFKVAIGKGVPGDVVSLEIQ